MDTATRFGVVRLGLATWIAVAIPGQAPGPDATFDVRSKRHWISSDERFALFDGGAGLQLLDVASAALVPLPASGAWHAGAFDAAGRHLWLVDAMGTARGFVLPTASTTGWKQPDAGAVVEIGIPKLDDGGRSPRFHDLAISADGVHLAWSLASAGERLAGAHVISTGAEVVRFDGVDTAAMSDEGQPWIAFVGAGAHVVVQVLSRRGEPESLGHDGANLVVHELATGRRVARFSPYVAAATPGYALLPDGLVVGTRSATRRWSIVRWRVGSAAPIELVSDARGGHFTDVHAEPGGRVVCEWDFEDDDGILVLDVVGERPPLSIAPGHAFVGFASPAAAGDAGGVLARGPDGVLRRHAWDTGTLQGELAMGAGFVVEAARWCLGSQRVLAVGRVEGSAGPARSQVRVWNLSSAAR